MEKYLTSGTEEVTNKCNVLDLRHMQGLMLLIRERRAAGSKTKPSTHAASLLQYMRFYSSFLVFDFTIQPPPAHHHHA
jgi:hypothetical protein